MPTDKQRLGDRGERLAEESLIRRGMTLVARNYRCRYGEIDRIMRDGETLAFVEVKTRRGEAFGAPAEAVTAHKRRQITRAALHYLHQVGREDAPCRFDVAEVVFNDGSPPSVRHIPGVFEAEEFDL